MLRRCHEHSARLHTCNKAAFDQLDNPTQAAAIKAAAAAELRGWTASQKRAAGTASSLQERVQARRVTWRLGVATVLV
jgi:hypothetical protein